MGWSGLVLRCLGGSDSMLQDGCQDVSIILKVWKF